MREYVLMTDSCCDLPDQMAKDLQLEVLPLTMHMDGQDYPNTLDGAAISNEEFYRRIRAGKMATTSAVNVGEFEEKMREILKTGKDILSISFSSALSTTYQSSVIAAEELKDEFPDAKILTVDSLCASLGQGLFVYLCAQAQKKRPLLQSAAPRLVLCAPHPSPLSSYRGFFGSRPMKIFSITVSLGNTCRDSRTWAMPRLATAWEGSP